VEVLSYIKENGVEKAIEKYCGLSNEDPIEKKVAELIIAMYYEMGDQYPFDINYIL